MTATELVTMLVEARQQGRLTRELVQLACFDVVPLLCLKARNLQRARLSVVATRQAGSSGQARP